MAARPTVAELLAEHARLMNKHGADSEEVKNFVEQHRDDDEFTPLAETAKNLKKALTSR